MLKNTIFNDKNNFAIKASNIKKNHWNQNKETIDELNKKYKNIIFGNFDTWNFIEKLSLCVDPSDKELFCTSQWIHTWQVVEKMEMNNIYNEDFLIAAILHDLGKILLLTDELPQNIVCDNGVIGEHKEKIGWENCITHWNHDEFIYMKLKNHIHKDYSWLLRYHSINLKHSYKYANDYDKNLIEKLLLPFSKYDKLTKSIFNIPKINIDKYKRMIEKHLPKTLEI